MDIDWKATAFTIGNCSSDIRIQLYGLFLMGWAFSTRLASRKNMTQLTHHIPRTNISLSNFKPSLSFSYFLYTTNMQNPYMTENEAIQGACRVDISLGTQHARSYERYLTKCLELYRSTGISAPSDLLNRFAAFRGDHTAARELGKEVVRLESQLRQLSIINRMLAY